MLRGSGPFNCPPVDAMFCVCARGPRGYCTGIKKFTVIYSFDSPTVPVTPQKNNEKKCYFLMEVSVYGYITVQSIDGPRGKGDLHIHMYVCAYDTWIMDMTWRAQQLRDSKAKKSWTQDGTASPPHAVVCGSPGSVRASRISRQPCSSTSSSRRPPPNPPPPSWVF